MAYLLFLLLNFESSYVLLKLPLDDAVVVFGILESDFGLFFELSQLVEVLEDKVLHSLFVDLDLYLVFFAQILKFTLLVAQLCLLVFQLLFAHDPEVVNSLTLVLI